MNDTISRQAVLDILKHSCVWHDRIEAIEALPSADAVEVVRCRNCKHVQTINCPFFKAKWGYTDDDYCSCGERREDGEA